MKANARALTKAGLAAWALCACTAHTPPVIKVVAGQRVEQRRIDPAAYEHAARAYLLEEDDRAGDAADEVRRALGYDRSSPELWAHLAELELQLGRTDEADRAVKESLSRGDTPQGLIARAHVAQARGDAAAAVTALRRAGDVARSSVDPSESEATQLELAEAQAMALDVDGGSATLAALASAAPTSTAARVRAGAFSWALGDVSGAERHFKSALAIEPNHLDARLLLAWLYVALGRSADARASFDDALDRSEGSVEIAQPYARFLMMIDKPDDARELVDGLPLVEDNEDTALARVALERIVKRPQKAFALIATHLNPDASADLRARLHLASAQLLQDAGREKEALDLLLAVPADAGAALRLEARLRAATQLRQAGKPAEAIRALEDAPAEGDDGDIERTVALALCDEKAAAAPNALARLDAALGRHPNDARLLLAKAGTLERAGRWRDALAIARGVRARDPGNVEALNFWGFVAVDNNHDLPTATKHVRAAMALEPGAGAIIDSVGWALFRAGDLPAATRFLEQAARLEPEDPEVLSHLAELQARRGDKARAEATFRKVLTMKLEDRRRREVEARVRALGQTLGTP